MSPKERTRWRFTFRKLIADATAALRDEDLETAAAAVEVLIDLACATRDYDYFRSEDPMQAAGVVISDTVGQLWHAVRDRKGFAVFAATAAPQLLRWESPYGWTRYGVGRVADEEETLAEVLSGMLQVPDHWETFAEQYLKALEAVAAGGARARRAWSTPERDRSERARTLAGWHDLLREHLAHSEDGDLRDRLTAHPAPVGPKATLRF